MTTRLLIVDYSRDRSEAAEVRRWLPEGVDSDVAFVPFERDLPDILEYHGLIHTGSSYSICAEAPFDRWAENAVRKAAALGIPQMGICYGHQMICRALLGANAVRRCPNGLEAGWLQVSFSGQVAREMRLPEEARLFQSHLDEVVELPEGSEVFARSPHTEIQGFLCREPWLLGLQFHPEFDRDSGNRTFLGDPQLLLGAGLDPAEVAAGGPTLEAGTIFFGYYCDSVACRPRQD